MSKLKKQKFTQPKQNPSIVAIDFLDEINTQHEYINEKLLQLKKDLKVLKMDLKKELDELRESKESKNLDEMIEKCNHSKHILSMVNSTEIKNLS
jgi:hypothetical protein